MWERFTYYGMRGILILFLVDAVATGGFGLDDRKATAIYGLYTTATYLMALPGGWLADRLLGAQRAVVWGAALTGVALKMAKLGNGPGNAGSWLYIVIGWAAVAALPALWSSLDGVQLILMATGGLLFTVGAVVLARRWPDPLPRTFGYHEVWHAMTVAAAGCHFALIALVVH
jgi:channel protein (hemolysin III family)